MLGGSLLQFAERLEQYIEIEQRLTDGGLVLGLNGKYGAGKSQFDAPLVVLLNTWQLDCFSDPLFAIVKSTIDNIEPEFQGDSGFVESVKDIGWFGLGIGAGIARKIGVDAVGAKKLAEDQKDARAPQQPASSSSFDEINARYESLVNLRKAIADFVGKQPHGVMFFVDELDRCRPDYAISYLEVIKHFFDTGGATFVLAIDRDALENSARSAFGQDLDFDEYYRKFVHREVKLPPVKDYRRIADDYLGRFILVDELRKCAVEFGHHNIERIVELTEYLSLTPRQFQTMFRVLGHVLSYNTRAHQENNWCFVVATLAMVAFSVGKPDLYNDLSNGLLSHQDAFLLDAQIAKNSGRTVGWWYDLLASGGGIDQATIPEDYDRALRPAFSEGWGWRHESSNNQFIPITKRIEELYTWEQTSV